jgi:hypothetical protein
MVVLSFTSNLLSDQVDSLPRTLPMSLPPAWSEILDFFGMQLVIEVSQGQPSDDAGLLPIRQFDAIRITQRPL